MRIHGRMHRAAARGCVGDSHGVGEWLGARCARWRDRVEVVAIDPSAASRNARGERLPHAAVSVHGFHLVKLVNEAPTEVRQRLVRERHARRGRLVDPSCANRRLLLRGADTLTDRAWLHQPRLTPVLGRAAHSLSTRRLVRRIGRGSS